ncbi:putative alanine racemase-domain-containing protein [Dissophora ornata]|nr:putative alanine racemase-domain-containing protein [Dissophora ornata]
MNVIENPLETIQDLFNKNWKQGQQSADNNEFGVTEHFQSLFDSREKLLQIPVLDAQSINVLPINSLVRFRCMVQDTELSQEVALFATTVITQPDGEEKVMCHRYSDGPQDGHSLNSDPNRDLMDLRNSYYCVSVPGESQWVREHERSKTSSLDTALRDMKLEEAKTSQVIPERYPFPGANHFAAIVKSHSSDVSIGVTDLVEVVGVLGASDRLISGDSFDFHEESANTPRIPTVHAILMRKVEDHGHPELSLSGHPEESDVEFYTKDAETIRKDLIQYIATAVHGDLLAAELVLLHFLARVHSRPSGTVLGKFSLNLKDSTQNSLVYHGLARVMKNILPKVHTISMNLQNLNENFFFPRGEEQLSSGILQVTRGTSLLLDETAMEEGTLVDKGLKNLKAVSDVSLYQTLNYVFPYSNLEFQTDISLLIVSNGNSLIPVDCAITLNPEPTAGEQFNEPTEAQLTSFRKYISVLRLAEYKLSEEMAKV